MTDEIDLKLANQMAKAVREEEIDLKLINQMAKAGGEEEFESIDPLPEEYKEVRIIVDEDTFDLNASANFFQQSGEPSEAFEFTQALKDKIKVQSVDASPRQRLKALVRNYQFDDPDAPKKTSLSIVNQLLGSTRRLFESLSNATLVASGGAAMASVFAVVLVFNQSESISGWESRYSENGTIEIRETFVLDGSSDFFRKRHVVLRDDTPKENIRCKSDEIIPGENTLEGCLDSSPTANSLQNMLLDKDFLSSLEPVLGATLQQGLKAAYLEDSNIWLLIRARLEGIDPSSGDDISSCMLVEAISSSVDKLPVDLAGEFLVYCPKKWANKLEIM